LNEKEYQSLCQACDDVLLDSEATIECMAISWLHVIREHPHFLKKYENIFTQQFGIRSSIKNQLRNVFNLFMWIRQFGRSVYLSFKLRKKIGEVGKGVDYLFVSHLLNYADLKKTDDFYFSGLDKYIINSGYLPLTVLINHTKFHHFNSPRIVLSRTLGVMEELPIFIRLIKEWWRLNRLSKETEGIAKKVLITASREALSQTSAANIRLGLQIAQFVKQTNPKVIVITHEGHAWERVVFSMVRDVCSNICCIGYQHAALFRLQHAVCRNLSSQYNPDHVLTAGSVTKKRLEKIKGISVSELGSPRYSNKKTSEKIKLDKLDVQSCLVLPEGIGSECQLLFDFSLLCAQQLPNVKFIWRLHPVIDYAVLIKENSKLKFLPDNIILSKKSIDEDIKQCKYAIYRGSTAVIQAVCAGLRPIYLHTANEMTIDPIFELSNKWRKIVSSSGDVEALLQEDLKLLAKEKNVAVDYCSDYFSKMNYEVIQKFI